MRIAVIRSSYDGKGRARGREGWESYPLTDTGLTFCIGGQNGGWNARLRMMRPRIQWVQKQCSDMAHMRKRLDLPHKIVCSRNFTGERIIAPFDNDFVHQGKSKIGRAVRKAKDNAGTGDTAGEICSSTTSPIASSPSFVITSFHLDSIALRDFRGC